MIRSALNLIAIPMALSIFLPAFAQDLPLTVADLKLPGMSSREGSRRWIGIGIR